MRRTWFAVLTGILILAPAASFAADGPLASTTPRDKYERGYRMIVHAKSEGDIAEAVGLIKAAAAEKFIPAYTLLGTILSQGTFLHRDPKEAERLLKEAAKAGDATAMNNLAVLYAEGDGIPADMPQAKEWAEKAAQKGMMTATGLIAQLEARDGLRQAAKANKKAQGGVQVEPAKGLTPPPAREADVVKAEINTPSPAAPAQVEVPYPPAKVEPASLSAVTAKSEPATSYKLARIIPSRVPGRRTESKVEPTVAVPVKETMVAQPASLSAEPAVAESSGFTTAAGTATLVSLAKPAVGVPEKTKSPSNAAKRDAPRKVPAAKRSVFGGTGPSNDRRVGGVQPFYVQLASIGVDSDPEKEWSRLNRMSRGALGGEQPVFQVVEVERKNASYIRILLGPHDSKADAEASCRRLTTAGVKNCLVKRD